MAGITFLSNIAIDLGSASTRICADSDGSVYTCASQALVSARSSSDVYAVGDDARRMEGRTSDESILVSPISYGGVAETELTAMLMLSAAEKATGRRRPFEKSRPVLTVNNGCTRVERAALLSAAELAGSKRALVIEAPVAAAVNMGRHIEKAEAQLIVSIGASTTEVTVVSAYGVVLSRHKKTGSCSFDDAITRYIRKNMGLVIARYTAAEIKQNMGSAIVSDRPYELTLRGVSVMNGRPVSAVVTTEDVRLALNPCVDDLVGSICDALYNVPAEFSADVLKNGICLTGGGSNLHGLDRRLEEETGLKVAKSEDSSLDAVLGAYKIAEDDRLCRQVLSAYSAYEI